MLGMLWLLTAFPLVHKIIFERGVLLILAVQAADKEDNLSLSLLFFQPPPSPMLTPYSLYPFRPVCVCCVFTNVHLVFTRSSNSLLSRSALPTPVSAMKRRSSFKRQINHPALIYPDCMITASVSFSSQRWQHTPTRAGKTLQLQLRLHSQEQQWAFSAAGRDTWGNEVNEFMHGCTVEYVHCASRNPSRGVHVLDFIILEIEELFYWVLYGC